MRNGFTFIELLVTLAIMAVLALVAVPAAQRVQQRQQEHELRLALTQIREGLDAYKRAAEQGHMTLQIGESGYPHKLEDLVEGVPDERSPSHQMLFFLRALPRDPLNGDASLSAAATWQLRSYESPADDPQPGDDVFDVHSRATGVGLNGVPYAQW